jgi:hypothetical protein
VLKVWPKRYRDLGRTRTQVVCRLHAVLCELVPGGVAKAITAAAAARLPGSITPAGAVDAARCELAARSSRTCAASTPSCARPGRRSPPRCRPLAPA